MVGLSIFFVCLFKITIVILYWIFIFNFRRRKLRVKGVKEVKEVKGRCQAKYNCRRDSSQNHQMTISVEKKEKEEEKTVKMFADLKKLYYVCSR